MDNLPYLDLKGARLAGTLNGEQPSRLRKKPLQSGLDGGFAA